MIWTVLSFLIQIIDNCDNDRRTMELFTIVLCGTVAVIFAFYYYYTSKFDFWKSRGVPGPHPIPVFGTFKDVMLKKLSMCDYVAKVYNDYKDEPLVGIFAKKTPILIVKDPDLLKDIFIKDFPTFADKGFPINEKTDPLSQNLFFLEPKRWRPLRIKLSPVFTSRKLKGMFLLIAECADHLIQHMEKVVSRDEPINCSELTAKYTTDVIGHCVFGIEINAMSNETCEFRRIGRNLLRFSFRNFLLLKIKRFSLWLYNILSYIIPQMESTKFFIRLVVDTINYREKNNIVRNDFIDILRELKKNSTDIDFTDGLMASQAYTFFAAGFETSSTAMTNGLYELALNQKIQDRLREEIDEYYVKYAGNLTYDNIKEMNYLDKVFKEILRKYPVGLFFRRRATSSYTFSNIKISIPKGQRIWIPLLALHRDPRFYPSPDVFDPERFNEEAVQNRHPMVYIPFGEGPRNCLGSRFAVYQTKLGLIKILRNYKVECCEKTPIPYEFDESSFTAVPKHGIYLKIIKLNRA